MSSIALLLHVTIVNVALPSIEADLGFSQAGLAWVVNAYLIAFGGLAFLPVAVVMGTLSVRYTDRLSARFGVRKTLVGRLALIVVALFLFAQAPVGGDYSLHVLPVAVLMGAGRTAFSLASRVSRGLVAREASLVRLVSSVRRPGPGPRAGRRDRRSSRGS